ncbi:MAG: ABC transporter ATP-binding protein [Hyphomicrobiaceae bacterium]
MDLSRFFSGQSKRLSAELGNGPIPRARAAATFAARVTFEGVCKSYEDHEALCDFELDVAPGEVICLLGPSGCGKTTLLRVASGIEKPTAGRMLINGVEMAGPNQFVPPEKRGVGLMFQDFALFPHLTIIDNVAFGLKALPVEEARREAMSVLARVGLDKYAEQYPHILSGGQQQRVALARAIVPRPAVVLMDEPFSGLDVQLRDSMQEETLGLLRETRATSIIVTHNPEEALRLGDRIAVMWAGRLVQIGAAEDLYHHPNELFIARLFSEINEVSCLVQSGVADSPIGPLSAPGIADGNHAIVCIREQGIGIEAPGQAAIAGHEPEIVPGLPGRILHRKFLGDIGLLEIAVQGFEAPIRVRAIDHERWAPGIDVVVRIDPKRVLVFPAFSGEKGETGAPEPLNTGVARSFGA